MRPYATKELSIFWLNERRFSMALLISCERNLAVACRISECNLSDWRAVPILSKIKERSVRIAWLLSLLLLVTEASLYADGPGDNLPDKVRPVPPPGVAVPAAEQAELESGVAELGKEIEALRVALRAKPALLD